MVARFGFMWTTRAEMRAEKVSTSRLPVIVWSASSRIVSYTRSCPQPRRDGHLLYGSLATTPSARRTGRAPGSGRRTFRLVNFVSVLFNVNILVRLQGLRAD